jgi:hypothetical protein
LCYSYIGQRAVFDSCSEIHIITSGCANIFLFTVSSTGTLP